MDTSQIYFDDHRTMLFVTLTDMVLMEYNQPDQILVIWQRDNTKENKDANQ
jgi:hypothetical protein